MIIQVRRVNFGRDLPLPNYHTDGAACFDLRAAFMGKVYYLHPRMAALIPCGIEVAIPEGFELQCRGRSGLACRQDILAHWGTIDSDYRGELFAKLFNLSDETYEIKYGDRIAQCAIAPVIRASFEEVPELPPSGRGSSGFGSTGR